MLKSNFLRNYFFWVVGWVVGWVAGLVDGEMLIRANLASFGVEGQNSALSAHVFLLVFM